MIFFLLSGLFEVRVQEYLDSIHENEHRRVNRFLKGLGKVISQKSVPEYLLVVKSHLTTLLFLFLYSRE